MVIAMKPKLDWVIHLVKNGVACACCGEVENGFVQYACNSHTHGMAKYNHPDFQLVLSLPDEEIGRILNTLGLHVQAGERFHNGDLVEGIYLDCPVRLQEFEECDRTILRVVIPDKHNRFPEDTNCEYPYTLQIFDTEFLSRKGGFSQ